jgi:predicted ATP-dependent protease
MTKAHKTKAIKAIEQACGCKISEFQSDAFGPLIMNAMDRSDDLDDLALSLRAELDYVALAMYAIRRINQDA